MPEKIVISHVWGRREREAEDDTGRPRWDGEAELLICELLPALRRKAAAMAHPPTAEDIVQTACERLLIRSAELMRHPNPRAYALRTVATVAYDQHRARRRETPVAEVPDRAVADVSLELYEAQWEVSRLLGRLSDGQAAAIRLVDIDGHSIDHAAALLGVHRGTVSRARWRGLRRLNEEVGGAVE
ncbi:RNA polymerase sigma factor [Streptomyces pratensis]|uniref:RNA polymerase sigma factor n=1 Tax=Streptomyces pratensis TaxID=1169025 RepID=UPI003018A69F